jgi:soluble cytochrome b562
MLAHVLLQLGITKKLPKPVTDGIRAIAFLIEDTHSQQIAGMIVEGIKLQLGEQMEGFNSDMEAMRDAVEHVTDTAKMITRQMDEFKDGFQEMAEQLVQATQELTEKTVETTDMTAPTLAQVPITYTAVAQQYKKNTHTEVIARGAAANKQILIQRNRNNTGNTDDTLPDLTEKELVTKVNTALDLMGWEGLDKPQHTTFLAARKLCNGDILYQVNEPEAVEWL